MEKIMEFLNLALSWLNQPTVKYGIGIVGGFLWKQYPTTVNRAYPFVAMLASVLLTASQALTSFLAGFGDGGVAGASFVSAAYAAVTTVDAKSLLVDIALGTVLPVFAAVGTHSWWKNLLQWLADGYRIRKPAE